MVMTFIFRGVYANLVSSMKGSSRTPLVFAVAGSGWMWWLMLPLAKFSGALVSGVGADLACGIFGVWAKSTCGGIGGRPIGMSTRAAMMN